MKLDRLALLNGVDRSQKHPFVEPRQAASLLVINCQEYPYKILMGRRTAAAAFMPDVFVYPGGAVDRMDLELARQIETANPSGFVTSDLLSHCHKFAFGQEALQYDRSVLDYRTPVSGSVKATLVSKTSEFQDELICDRLLGLSLGLCAVRELYEETGLRLGAARQDIDNANAASSEASPAMAHPYHGNGSLGGVMEGLKCFARAITPPGRKMRFDTKFFAREYCGEEIRANEADGELSHMQWVSYEEASALKLHPMTRVILEDLHEYVVGDGELLQPDEVAFYHYVKDSFYHEVIDFHSSS